MAKTAKKNKGGRPKEKASEKCDLKQVERLATLGLTDVEMGIALGKSEPTINRWKKDPKFMIALKKGKEVSDRRVELSLYKSALGYEYTEVTEERARTKDLGKPEMVETKRVTKQVAPNPTSCIFWLKNRKKEEWRDRVDHNLSGELGLEVGGIEVTFKNAGKEKNSKSRVSG